MAAINLGEFFANAFEVVDERRRAAGAHHFGAIYVAPWFTTVVAIAVTVAARAIVFGKVLREALAAFQGVVVVGVVVVLVNFVVPCT